jgi:hypothetical protein
MSPSTLSETQLAALYGEFEQDDRGLAETGMTDYASALDVEGIDLDISTSEIIECIHEGRKPL